MNHLFVRSRGTSGRPTLRRDLKWLSAGHTRMITCAKAAYDANDTNEFRLRIADTVELVNISYKSPVDTDAAIRVSMRRLESVAAEVGFDDSELVTDAHKPISQLRSLRRDEVTQVP